jgi:hypothetical protein
VEHEIDLREEGEGALEARPAAPAEQWPTATFA